VEGWSSPGPSHRPLPSHDECRAQAAAEGEPVGEMKRVPRDVSVFVYRLQRSGARVLMLRRQAERGGFWQGVTGAPNPGEGDADAAVREVSEETGFDISTTLQSLNVTYSCVLTADRSDRWAELYGPDVRAVTVVAFAAAVPAGADPVLDAREHDAFAWCTYAEAMAMLDWPVEQDALEDRRESLRALGRLLGLIT
jgi:8-oxo-dGTP pyrophosphatase MutT (NUDIX family)